MDKAVSLSRDINKYYVQSLFLFLTNTALLLITSGNYAWVWAWIFIIIFPVYTFINALVLPGELLAERGRTKVNIKSWDKILIRLAIVPALAVIVVAGLDERFRWTDNTSLLIHLPGLLVYILGDIIVTWAMASNKFFSTHVRIQSDRDHKVITNGPYRFVRHPGYTGIILNTLSTPLILGSLWALIPAFMLAILYVIRTVLEDHTLKEELEGYRDYSVKVKYRLLPWVW